MSKDEVIEVKRSELDIDNQDNIFVYLSHIDNDTPCLLIDGTTKDGRLITLRISDKNLLKSIEGAIEIVRLTGSNHENY